MHEPTEPTYDITERPCLILELPELSDETAWQLSEFLQALAEHIDAHYSAQILRAHLAREREHERLYREQLLDQAQQSLPFPDPAF